ncbi:Wax ester synthase/diacylglycerol acyltransferase 5 [Linum grandiflorum]
MAGQVQAGELVEEAAVISANMKAAAAVKAKTSSEALSPAARLFHSPKFNCYIVAIMGYKTKINPAAVKSGLERTLIKHPRFSSKLVVDGCKGRKMKWERTLVNLDDHIVIPNLDDGSVESPDEFVEDYVSHLSTFPLDSSKPLWELHLLNVKTSDAEAVGVFKIHHSVGDGASLVSLLLACTRNSSDPQVLPTLPVRRRTRLGVSTGGYWWFFQFVWMLLKLMWNTLVDSFLLAATMLFLTDTKTPIKAPTPEGQNPRRFVHRTVSLDDIKLVKNSMNTTINDVVLGVTQGGLSQYLYRRYGENEKPNGTQSKELPRNIRLRACVLVNLRPRRGIQDLADLMVKGPKAKWGWGNWIGYLMLPLTIAVQDDPLDHIRGAKLVDDRKKLSLEPIFTCLGARLVIRTLGVKVASWIASRVLFNTTFAFSNMVGPVEEISFYGHPISYLAPSVYGHPHALTIHFQSYCNKMTISLAVDPGVISDPHVLCNDIEDSLKAIKEAVVQKFLQKGPDTV